ncbi:MAG: undecaprenyl-phosphate glucose phosphotransferase [Muribaculaceae bacterium]|nr:undecaprenyl-phosphate glucose phosphotransferase [Muribaculaceae bacterium]
MLQTLLDIIIVGGVFVVLLSAVGWEKFIADYTHGGVWRIVLTVGVVALVSSRFCFEIHQRRMLRAEKLFGMALVVPLVSTLLYAAMMMFTGAGSVSFRFFAILYLVQAALLFIAWIIALFILRRLRRNGRNARNIVIFGTGQAAKHLALLLKKEQGYGMNVMGFFDNRIPTEFSGNYIGSIDKLGDFIRDNNIHDIFYASSMDNDLLINRIIRLADQHFCKLYFTPLMSPKLQHSFYMDTFNSTIPAIAVHDSPLRSMTNRAIKRTFDVLFSGCVLLVSPLVFIPVAIAIKISSPGPVFFKQLRTGYLGKEFYCYKFRTMRVSKDADTRQATKDDDRKTRLGNFLRHTSIDELPQFWNVMKGDMSVVGPRPHMLAHTEEYRQLIDQYMVRHLVKPGITGWAQILGFRGATDELWQMERRIDNDVWYIEHWSLFLDLKIIVRTITNALTGEENAY